jgi:surface polysaccharide O-acyltransferase-like enzyme
MKENRQKKVLLSGLLIIQTVGLLIYTFIAIQNDGGNFLAKALEYATSMTWMGQFALDFACYLLLSSLWILWRNKFTPSSILMAIAANILGIIVFAPYLVYLIYNEKGDLKSVLVGDR